jgi:hypothetical protein
MKIRLLLPLLILLALVGSASGLRHRQTTNQTPLKRKSFPIGRRPFNNRGSLKMMK